MTLAPRRAVDLSPRALLAAGVSGVLAADLSIAEGGRWTLATRAADIGPDSNGQAGTETAPVPIVSIRGPLEQRAAMHDPCGGMTDGYDAIESRFNAAARQVHRAGAGRVVLDIDSPGGDAAGSIELARRMRATADRLGVMVHAVASEHATSAAFTLAIAADRVDVPRLGRTASIGTVIVRRQEDGADKIEVIRSGDRKMRPNAVEPLNEADRNELQSIVDARAADFAQWVAERRGGDAQKWLDLKGASMSGEEAARRGLIDGNLTAHEVIAMATAEASRASIVAALGLAATASDEEAIKTATAGKVALEQVSTAEAKAAEASGKLLALEARVEREQRERQAAEEQERQAAAKAKARATFAAEVATARIEGRLSPKSEAALVAFYDAHGEPAARASLATVLEAGTALQGGRAGHKPAASGEGSDAAGAVGALTDAHRQHAKDIGVTEAEYAARVFGPAAAGGAT